MSWWDDVCIAYYHQLNEVYQIHEDVSEHSRSDGSIVAPHPSARLFSPQA